MSGVPLVVTGSANAELVKSAANGFLAMKIAFINEIADLCERFGGDVADIARAIGMDARIGPAFLQAGPGYGGSCFPKDTRALASVARRHTSPVRLIEAVAELNERRLASLADRVCRAAGGSVRGLTVAVLGVAFKANTDDVRDSPAMALLQGLHEKGARTRVYDPKAMENGRRRIRDAVWCSDLYEACQAADIAVIATEWEEFRDIDLRRLRASLSGDLLVDFRNIFGIEEIAGTGLRYVSVGRPMVDSRVGGLVAAVDEGRVADGARARSACKNTASAP
jgi:UDPglucose 6-dehydrogenase